MAGMAIAPHLYLEVAATVPVFILAGRWFELRAKRNGGAALAQARADFVVIRRTLDGAA